MGLMEMDLEGKDPAEHLNSRELTLVFSPFEEQTNFHRGRYIEECEKKAEYQRKKKAEKEAQQYTTVYNSIQEYTTQHDKDKDKDKEKEKEKEEEKEKEKEKDIFNYSADEFDRILSAWNSQTFIKAKIDRIPFGSRRYDNTQLCIVEYGFSTFLEEILNLDNNAFFKDWHPSYDWFSNPNNFMKVRDGNYREKRKDPNEIDWEAL